MINVSVSTEDSDLSKIRQLLHPSRIEAMALIHAKDKVTMPELSKALGLKNNAVQAILDVLVNLGLITVGLEPNPGHGSVRVARSALDAQSKCFVIKLLLEEEK